LTITDINQAHKQRLRFLAIRSLKASVDYLSPLSDTRKQLGGELLVEFFIKRVNNIALSELELRVEAVLGANSEYIVHHVTDGSVGRFELSDWALDPATSIRARFEQSCLSWLHG
jgi:hypothetical protein